MTHATESSGPGKKARVLLVDDHAVVRFGISQLINCQADMVVCGELQLILNTPLGARAQRSGRSYTFAMGFAIILSYYVLQMLMEPKALYSLGVVLVRAWIPNLALSIAGIIFLWRVDRV